MDSIGLLAIHMNVNNSEDSKKRERGIIVLQPCLLSFSSLVTIRIPDFFFSTAVVSTHFK